MNFILQAQIIGLVPNGTSDTTVHLKVAEGYLNNYFFTASYGYVFNNETLQPYMPGYNTEMNYIRMWPLSSDNNTGILL